MIQIQESFRLDFSEAVFSRKDLKPLEIDVTLIEAGMSMNRNNYSLEILERDALPLVHGMAAFIDHGSMENEKEGKKRLDRKLDEKAGWYRNPYMQGSELRAILRIFEHKAWVYNMLREQSENPDAQIAGISINAFGEGFVAQENGRNHQQVEKIVQLMSGDVVDIASAGGKPNHILESLQSEQSPQGGELVDITMEQLEKDHPELFRQMEEKCMGALREEFLAKDKAIEVLESENQDLKKKEAKLSKDNEGRAKLEIRVEELSTRITKVESEKTALQESLKQKDADDKLNAEVARKVGPLKEKFVCDEMRSRLIETLLRLGPEKREKENGPSNWDLRIKEDLDIVSKIQGASENVGVLNSERLLESATSEAFSTQESLKNAEKVGERISRVQDLY